MIVAKKDFGKGLFIWGSLLMHGLFGLLVFTGGVIEIYQEGHYLGAAIGAACIIGSGSVMFAGFKNAGAILMAWCKKKGSTYLHDYRVVSMVTQETIGLRQIILFDILILVCVCVGLLVV